MGKNVREKIVTAAIECLELYGMAGTTIRKVAGRAGVNSAAISYYFGGVDNLIETAMGYTLAQAFNFDDYNENDTLKDYLKAVFCFQIQGAYKFPNISKAHFYKIYIEGDYSSAATAAVNGFLEKVLTIIRSKTRLSEDILRRRLFILMAQAVYFAVTPKLLDGLLPLGAAGEKEIALFVNNSVDNLFYETECF